MHPAGPALAAAVAAVPVTGTWFRAIRPQFHATALATVHTATTRSRFNAGPLLPVRQQFEILHLAETPQVALFEVGALLGSPFRPGAAVAPVTQPTGPAPTQDLGQGLHRLGVAASTTVSARVPTHRTLGIVPQNLGRTNSSVSWFDPITGQQYWLR
jgi:hypothetical protein